MQSGPTGFSGVLVFTVPGFPLSTYKMGTVITEERRLVSVVFCELSSFLE